MKDGPYITPRHLELLARVASGTNIDESAKAMFISPRTAYNMLAAAKRNAGAGTVERLVVIALHEGWLETDDEGDVSPAADLIAD